MTHDEKKNLDILVVDDHIIFREGLCAILVDHQYNVIGEANTGEEAVQLAPELGPDIILMDITMPGIGGIEATRQIVRKNPATRVIGLSMRDDQHYVSEMLTAGASGYLPKGCNSDELASAIDAVANGGRYLSPAIAGGVVDEYVKQRSAQKESVIEDLTKRQIEILRMIADGLSQQEIAENLNLSVKTVHAHRDRIMARLNTRSVADLTKIALREGLIKL